MTTDQPTWTIIPANDQVTTVIRSQRATPLGQAYGYRFYEHPFEGDEHPILALDREGNVFNTREYDLPDWP
jgi:hypothetical protein